MTFLAGERVSHYVLKRSSHHPSSQGWASHHPSSQGWASRCLCTVWAEKLRLFEEKVKYTPPLLNLNWYDCTCIIINPRRACAARVAVVVLSFCLSVCLSVATFSAATSNKTANKRC